jgi:hypothetical protein
MSDGEVLGTILAVIGVIMLIITTPDRKISRRWWRRRHVGDRPTQRVLLSLAPMVFWVAAAVAFWMGREK